MLPPFELIIDWSEQLPYPFLRNRLQMRPYMYKMPSHTHAHPLYYTPFNWKLGKWINNDPRAQRLPLEEKRRTSHKPNTLSRLRLEFWPGGTAACWLDSSPCSPKTKAKNACQLAVQFFSTYEILIDWRLSSSTSLCSPPCMWRWNSSENECIFAFKFLDLANCPRNDERYNPRFPPQLLCLNP